MKFENIDDNFFIREFNSITEELIEKFSEVTKDFNSIHVSHEEAVKAGFKTKVLHGVALIGLVSSIISKEFLGDGTIILEINSKFSKPAYLGDKISINVEVEKKYDLKKTLKLGFLVRNQKDERLAYGKILVMEKKN